MSRVPYFFGRPLRSVLFDVAVSAWVLLFALAGVVSATGGWKSTLIGVAMAIALLFRRPHPTATARPSPRSRCSR